MKKFLSILLTLCLMLTVVVVPLTAVAETSNTTTYDFTSYSYANRWVRIGSGRVAQVTDPWDSSNKVMKYFNQGIPYSSAGNVKSEYGVYTKSGSTYTQVASSAIDTSNYKNYYTKAATLTDLNSSLAADSAKWRSSAEVYNAIELGQLEPNTTYNITISYRRKYLTDKVRIVPALWAASANQRTAMTVYTDNMMSLNSRTSSQDGSWQSLSTQITTPVEFATSGDYVANVLRLIIFTGKLDNQNEVYFDNITVEKVVTTTSVTYIIPENATVNGQSGTVTVEYNDGDAITFPEVTYAAGYEFDAWKDGDGQDVTTPVAGGTYTLSIKESIPMVTITFNRNGVTEKQTVVQGTEVTLPDTKFTDTSWWNNSAARQQDRFVGYEGETIVANANATYYTAENYATTHSERNNVYRNWTELDTDEGFSYYRVTTTDANTTAWDHAGSTRVCTRLGVVEDGNTYRISVTYKATIDTSIHLYALTAQINNSGSSYRNYLENHKVFLDVSESTDDWTTATFYVTADLPATVTASTNGLDDTKEFGGTGSGSTSALYLVLGKDSGNHNVDFAIKETLVEDLGKVVTAKGASILKDENVENGKQALRYYFDYATGGDGTTITVGNNEYTVKERGFIYTNGDTSYYTYNKDGVNYLYADGNATSGYADKHFMMWVGAAKSDVGKNNLVCRGITGEALANNWALDNGNVTFSTYVTGIPADSYDAKMLVRGYVIFEADGVEHIIYSDTVNRSVNGIANVLNQRH